MIFTRDFVTSKNHCKIASRMTKIGIHDNPSIILYIMTNNYLNGSETIIRMNPWKT